MSAVLQTSTVIEPMTEEDLGEVIGIERQIYEFPWTNGNFLDSLSSGYRCLVLRLGHRLIGYAVMMLGAGEAHLLNLSIDAREQRHGHGTRMLQAIVGAAREYGAVQLFLEVRPSNDAGRLLYAKHGFREIAVRPGYYPARTGREDALLLAMDL